MADNVNKPAHYQIGGVETIDVIRAKLGEGFGYYCEGNAIKYLTRWRQKGGVEDLRKASVYLGWLIESEMEPPIAREAYATMHALQACIDGHPATGGGESSQTLLTAGEFEAPPLTPAQEVLIERADEDAPTAHLKAGEAVNA